MERVREILRQHELGLNQRSIGRATGVSRSVVQEYLRRALQHGVTYAIAKSLTDEELRGALGKKTPGRQRAAEVEPPDFGRIHTELTTRKGVTLELLWHEWNHRDGGGYSYSTFCRRHREYARAGALVMRQDYEPGERMLTDYAGLSMSYTDAQSGEPRIAQIFVAVLGFSNLTYVEATESQKILCWINSHIRACDFFGGVTKAIYTDNLKAGVTKSDRYEPEIQRTFQDFGAHYSTTIFAVRVKQPRDKAKVEKAVQDVERRVLAPLRDVAFTSIGEINAAVSPLLAQHNSHLMRDYGASRIDLYTKAERQHLRPLPSLPFEVATWKQARVAPDYHIEFERHYYSVPYYHVRKEVLVKVTEHLIEVFLGNERIASHAKSSLPYRSTTVPMHMPPAHQAVKSWTAASFVEWAQSVGSQTLEFVTHLLTLPQFKEQSYRSILGLTRLHTKYGSSAFEEAVASALKKRLYSQRAVREILERSLPLSSTDESHENIRGEGYYH